MTGKMAIRKRQADKTIHFVSVSIIIEETEKFRAEWFSKKYILSRREGTLECKE